MSTTAANQNYGPIYGPANELDLTTRRKGFSPNPHSFRSITRELPISIRARFGTCTLTFSCGVRAVPWYTAAPTTDHSYRAARPCAPEGTPVALATNVRLPSAWTRKPSTVPFPPLRT